MSLRKILFRGSLIALLLSFGALRACHDKRDYFYFHIADAIVAEPDFRKPNNWTYKGVPFSHKASIDWNGESVHIFPSGRNMRIESPVLLSSMIVNGRTYDADRDGRYFETSSSGPPLCPDIRSFVDYKFNLTWPTYRKNDKPVESCLRVDDEISIELVPENGSEPLSIKATFRFAGTAWVCDCI